MGPFEELYCAFMLLGRFPGIECSQIFPSAGFCIYLAGVQAELTGFQFPNHASK
jgi:hypothetical protein